MAGIRYAETFLFTASTSASRDPALDRAILSAAARQLGEAGYGRMSLESIAAAAGTTVPSLRRRYRNKAELAAAVIGSLRVEELPAGTASPRAHALAILENFHSNLRAIPALAILGSLLAEEERHPELLRLFKTRLVEPRRALLRQALAAGGLPDSTDLDALTSMLIGSFYGRYVTIAASPTTGRIACSAPYGPARVRRCGGTPGGSARG
jgi:AcrR family transcriptional regulator